MDSSTSRTVVSDVGLSALADLTESQAPSTFQVLSKKQKAAPKRGVKSMKTTSVAPKRFKSSFIFFSMAKHKEIKEQLDKDGKTASKTMNITKMVSDAWRSISPEEKAKYDAMAKEDKDRYEVEKASYTAPPGSNKKKKRDPTAPRRPMSAFLAFANSRRAKVKAENMEKSNGDISKILSCMWKEEDEQVKQKYRDEEAALWAKYKAAMDVWRKEKDIQQKEEMEKQTKIEELERSAGNIPPIADPSFSERARASNSSRVVDLLSSSNQDEIMMAVSALRGVHGGSAIPVGSSLQQQQHIYGDLLRSGMNPFNLGHGLSGSVLGGNFGYPFGLTSSADRALLEMGLSSQRLQGLQMESLQNMLTAQAMAGGRSFYQNQLFGLTDQHSLSHLAALANAQNAERAQQGPGYNDDFSTKDK